MPLSGIRSSAAACGETTGWVLMVVHDRAVEALAQDPVRCKSVSEVRQLDDIDQRIVALLRQDARRSFQNIGQAVALSAPAVKRRVDRLQAEGVVTGYTAQVDPGRF